MIKVVGVKFKDAGKVYYFDPNGFSVEHGAHVIVETARGLEYGTVVKGVIEVEEAEIVPPLKPVVRVATKEDESRHQQNAEKKEKTLRQCQEKIDKHGLDMKLIDVEYTFDHGKVIFYFTSDGRVDFRDLVKDLAAVFKMRIELRQIGVRDEAKMLGGIGTCGKGLCCHTWLSEFEPVSIKMAKVQNLSLNPAKISGICGRLMCCLKYENDTYLKLRKGMPEPGERVKTKEGIAQIVDVNIFEERVKARLLLNEKDDRGEEKLSSDIHVYGKEEIQRLSKPGKKGKPKDLLEEIPAELVPELKDLLKD
jgi:cell fate regulator YaaT (PSP1 superfamily)